MTELSFQLYSARNVPSLEDFLVKLGKLGYTQTEGFGGLYADAAGLAAGRHPELRHGPDHTEYARPGRRRLR